MVSTDVSALQWGLCAFILFGAMVVRGLSGFGGSILATPLLAMVLPVHLAVTFISPLMCLTYLVLVIRDRNDVSIGEVTRLIVPTMIGVGAGIFLFNRLDHVVLLKAFGVFVLAYVAYSLWMQSRALSTAPCTAGWAYPASLTCSFFDTLFGGGGGPALVIYLHRRQLARAAFRATIVAIWLVESAARVTGYAVSGYYTSAMVPLFVSMLPAMWLGNYCGERLNAVVSTRVFDQVVAAVLAASGIALLAR